MAKEVKSSNISSIEYDETTSTLIVRFHDGSAYKYENVPLEVYHGLTAALSTGSYFYRNIRTSYPFSRA